TKFICKDVHVKFESKNTIFTNSISKNILKIPIAHGDGNYFANEDTLKELEDNDQIVFKYSSPEGNIVDEFNPNGSQLNIAGIINKNRNVLGMMPHPERATDSVLNKSDGGGIFRSIANSIIK
ncbi:MAG: phosphoribosylformylglycinamidine synthase subunit PurQ, partial [Melioribacteraceae bacterium]|nr:phosphoribosylformylglycinamidine synthase subunit PurQ [Melioribacteraceae bacterium]